MATNHILNALDSIAKAQAELQHTIVTNGNQGQDIARLEEQVMQLRNSAIKAEVANGVPTKLVAIQYGVSSARVSQIAPRTRKTN